MNVYLVTVELLERVLPLRDIDVIEGTDFIVCRDCRYVSQAMFVMGRDIRQALRQLQRRRYFCEACIASRIARVRRYIRWSVPRLERLRERCPGTPLDSVFTYKGRMMLCPRCYSDVPELYVEAGNIMESEHKLLRGEWVGCVFCIIDGTPYSPLLEHLTQEGLIHDGIVQQAGHHP